MNVCQEKRILVGKDGFFWFLKIGKKNYIKRENIDRGGGKAFVRIVTAT